MMKKRTRRVLVRTTSHYAKYILAEDLDAHEELVSDTAPTPRMVPRADMSRLLRWTARVPNLPAGAGECF
jgi:hypothetical protein